LRTNLLILLKLYIGSGIPFYLGVGVATRNDVCPTVWESYSFSFNLSDKRF
jgi:hypothetical protein